MLTRHQSMARFAVVVGVELVALAACLVPLVSKGMAWQNDCLRVGGVTTIAVLAAIAITSLLCFAWPKNKPESVIDRQLNRFMEAGIVTIYFINVVSLASVIVRTGGPANSLYAPLIPIQLSGIIFLQIEKEILVEERAFMPFLYTLTACVALFATHRFPGFFYAFWEFERDQTRLDYSSWNTGLTISGLLLAFLTYWLPKQKKLTETFKRWYPTNTSAETQSTN